MQDVVPTDPAVARSGDRVLHRLPDYLPRGNTLDDRAWRRRHGMLQWVLLLHVPALVGLGLLLGHPVVAVAEAVTAPLVCLVIGHLVTHRRWASFFVTGGLVFCSVALVLLSRGSIEGHFHFFIIIGFIALYQDWVPFLWNVTFTVLSHGIGTIWLGGQIFNHPAAQAHPWLWSFIHGVAVLLACVGMVIFWRVTEDEQTEKEAIGVRLATADAEIGRRQFTSDLLVNLARRNQSMLYRQLDIINHLEDCERDPDALAELFKLDHLATRVRRNAESLLVLAGEQAPRTWSAPVALRDVVRAAIAETEDLDRVVFAVDDRVSVSGAAVADLTHLLAELTENAVRFSPPETAVTIRARPNRRDEGGQLLTVEDWGVGMPRDDLAAANDLLAHPRDVDLAVSQRLGFHVVSRLAARHGVAVSLSTTPGSGITALILLPAAMFTPAPAGEVGVPAGVDGARRAVERAADAGTPPASAYVVPPTETETTLAGPALGVSRPRAGWLTPEPFAAAPAGGAEADRPDGLWRGWWNPEVHGADGASYGPPAFPTVVAAANGNGSDRHPVNGNGANGNGANGNGARRDDTVDRGAALFGPWTDADDGDAAPAEPAPPATTPVPRQAPIPVARQEPPAREVDAAPWSRPNLPMPSVPAPGPRPAVPHPRLDEPAATDASVPHPSPGVSAARGLRRRVPQSHLAPELREPNHGLADTAAPLSADAAATALSRYQASRQAAQAMVDVPAESRPIDEGERR